jgi:hypothetical protein
MPDGPERREAFQRFWADLYTAEVEDPLARIRGDVLAMRTAVLREYEALEDEERREAGPKFVEVRPPTLLREDGTTITPQRSGSGAGVERLQDSAFPRQRRTLTITTPRNNGLRPVQGGNHDCRVRLHAITPPA